MTGRLGVRLAMRCGLGLLLAAVLWSPHGDAAPDLAAEWRGPLAPFTTTVVELPGGKKMNCHLRQGTGAALVLIPGTWGDIHRFTPLIERLPREWPVAVIELCWQGGQVPPSLDMTMESVADDVLLAIDALKLERFYVAGHSIGGMLAVEIAGREVPGLRGAIPMEGWTHHTVVKTAFDGVVVADLTADEAAWSQASRARGTAHLSEEQRKAIASIWRGWNGYESLERSQVPILHVWGDRGKPRPDKKALQIPDRPSIEIAWMPDASHMFVIETPDELAEAVHGFILRMEEKWQDTRDQP